jgi:tripartite-type tricarboxylate transporter receptor subunit TctC
MRPLPRLNYTQETTVHHPSRRSIIAALAGAALLAASPVAAQAYPERPVRVVVTFPPGGGADNIARFLAEPMSKALGQRVVVENRAGANGVIGVDHVAKAAPDGYTLLLGSGGATTISPHLAKLPYDPLKDLAPISMIATNDGLLLVHPSFPATNVKEFIEVLKKAPGKYSFGSSGAGGPTHLAGELFKQQAGVDMQHVPYKGDGPAIADLIAGHIPIMVTVLATAAPHLRTGRVQAIAALGANRFPQLPQVPTLIESGFPGFTAGSWFGLYAPAGTPAAVVAKVNEAVRGALADPQLKEQFALQGSEPVYSTPAELEKYLRNEYEKWGKVITEAKIKID